MPPNMRPIMGDQTAVGLLLDDLIDNSIQVFRHRAVDRDWRAARRQ